MAERSKDVGEELGPSTDAPDNTVTISKNTRVEENRQREPSRNFASRARKLPSSSEAQDSNRYVTIQRGGATTPASVFEDDSINQVLLDQEQDHEDHVHDLVHDHHPEIHFRHLKP